MLGNWFKKRRLNKQTAIFWEHLRQGDTPSAFDLYERELAMDAGELSRELRAAYHLNHWLARRDAADAEALKLLTTGSPTGSQLAAAWEVFERLQYQSGLARALRQSDRALVPDSAATSAGRETETLEALGLALVETSPKAQARLDEEDRRASAELVLRLLGTPLNLSAEVHKRMRAHLLLWAANTLGKYGRIEKEPELLDQLPAERVAELKLAFAFGQAKAALGDNDKDTARRALELMIKLSRPEWRWQLPLAVGRFALDARFSSASNWFTELITAAELEAAPQNQAVFRFALALTQLQIGQFANAREILTQLTNGLTGNDQYSQVDSTLREAITTQSSYLTALSLLAGTRDWDLPVKTVDAGSEDHYHEILVQNRALWNELRAQLDRSVERLSASKTESASTGHLLGGMLAYMDRNVRLAPEQIAQFAAAVERVSSAQARRELKNIEGALTARAQATEEAVRLIRSKEYERLRALNETVLASLGDAIPSLVRAAVYLALWRADPGYDPRPDLQRLPRPADAEQLIDDCIAKVQVAYILRQLSEECLRLESDRLPPGLAPLVDFDADLAWLGALATTVIHLRRGNLAAAQESLPAESHRYDREGFVYARFYLAWQQGDAETCRAVMAAEGATHPILSRYGSYAAAISARGILQALETDQEESAWNLLVEFSSGTESDRLPSELVSLVVWLLERRKAQRARALLQHARRVLFADETNVPRELEDLHWLFMVLSAMVAANLKHYAACISGAEQLLTFRVPRRSVFGSEAVNYHVLAWVRFFKLAAEFGLAAGAPGEREERRRALQRSLAEQGPYFESEARVRPYISLLAGLLASLSTDALVEEKTITQLNHARQTLDLGERSAYVENVIGQLTWRLQLIEHFWQALRAGDFKLGRLLYQEELLPAFGVERMPNVLQLGMLFATWGTGSASTSELLHRLTVLEHEAPELSPAFLAEVRRHVEDSEKYLRLVEYLREQQFDEMVALIERADWIGYQPGSMPLVVAVLLLYAYYKTKRNQAAVEMGYQMSQATRLAQWVQDYGSLLLGYVLFDEQKYARTETDEDGTEGSQLNAVDALARISRSEVLGHNVDRYWAAAHFNNGLQLLAVNRREKAFDAFTRSLSQRGSNAANANLAPLFIHFGLQSLEAGHGQRAKQAFILMGQSLEAVPDASDNLLFKVLAEMGRLICEVLLGERADMRGDEFLELLSRIDNVEELPLMSSREEMINVRPFLERDLHLLAICQELRRGAVQKRGGRRKAAQLHEFLSEQIDALEALMGEAATCDATLLALKGVSAVSLSPSADVKAGLDLIDQALRLGVGSQKLIALRDKHQRALKEAKGAVTAVVDLFDLYLADSMIPLEIRASLVRRDNLAELYRMNRSYAPADVITEEVQQGVKALRRRLEHLRDFITTGQFNDDPDLQQFDTELEDAIRKLDEIENQSMNLQQKVMSLLAAKLRAQALS